MKHWTEIRTAACVARLGNVSAAAEELGLHRATVTRHIDALEEELGSKLFQRHRRGFTPTPLGHELQRRAERADDQFGELPRLVKGENEALTGKLAVTLVDGLVPWALPVLTAFWQQHPKVEIDLISDDKVLKLERAEADIALRIGARPDHPDYVVLPVSRLEMGFFGPQNLKHLALADFPQGSVAAPGSSAPGAPYFDWLSEHLPERAISLRSNSISVVWEAVRSGTLAGFLPVAYARPHGFTELADRRENWHETIWLVTHVDLHRTPGVQAFVRCVKRHFTGVF